MNKPSRSKLKLESAEKFRCVPEEKIADMLYARDGGMTVQDIVKTIFQATLLARLPLDTPLNKQQLVQSLCEVFRVNPDDVQQIFIKDFQDFSKLPMKGPYVISPVSYLAKLYVSDKGVNKLGEIHGFGLAFAWVKYEGKKKGLYFQTLIYPSDRGFTANGDALVDDNAVFNSLPPVTIQSPLSADAIGELQQKERDKIQKAIQEQEAVKKKYRLTKVDTFGGYNVYTTLRVQPQEIASYGYDDRKKFYITIHPDAYGILRKSPEYLKIVYLHELEHIDEVRFQKAGPEHGKDPYIFEFLRANGYDFGGLDLSKFGL